MASILPADQLSGSVHRHFSFIVSLTCTCEVVPLVNLVSVQDLSVTVDVDHDRSSLNANFYFKGLTLSRVSLGGDKYNA